MAPERRSVIDTASLIAPLSHAGRAGEIADRLTEAIHLGLLADGEHLPPEAEFAQHLAVAPMTLREAIATLRERGLVETRRGRNGGTFVRRQLEPPEQPDRQRLASTTAGQLRDLADEQGAISAAAARLAAERSTPHDLQRLTMLADLLATASTRGARMRADSRFHIEIAVATRSERLLRREVLLRAESSGMLWLPYLGAPDVDLVCTEHDEILAAIKAEDGDGAHAAATRHVRNDLRRLVAGHRSVTAHHPVTEGSAHD